MSVVKKQTVTKAWLNSAANANTLNAGDFYIVERDGTYQATSGSAFAKVEQADMPTFGTAAAKNVEDFATSEQGQKADSAIQQVKTINGQSILGTGDLVINTNAPLWVSGTAYTNGSYVVSPLSSHVYMKRTASGASAIDPANDKTNWRLIGAGGIKSIQSGTLTIAGGATTASATIAQVVPNACLVEYTHVTTSGSNTAQIQSYALSATQITFTRASGSINFNPVVGWTVVEYWS